MVELFIISLVAFSASFLTFFSGFGLGTILMPVLAVFMPLQTAIALTAIVHLLNNIFKLFLVGKYARKDIVIHFGIPALLMAFIGAQSLFLLDDFNPFIVYELGSRTHQITYLKITLAILMILFIIFESTRFKELKIDPKYTFLGGMLSGFFGGLSGHQGALRSAFLVKYALSKEQFIATGVIIACLVDIARLVIYAENIFKAEIFENVLPLIFSVLAALLGAFLGNRWLKKITFHRVQIIVSVLLGIIALLLAIGLI